MFMVLFPVFLTFLLGSVLSSYFENMDKKLTARSIKICYLDQGNESLKKVFEAFKDRDFSKDNNLELEFIEEESIESGKDEVRVNKKIFIHLNEDEIDFYSNDNSQIKASFVYGILNSISKRYSATAQMYKINPEKTTEILSNNNKEIFIEEELLKENKNPRAIDYYGVAEIGLMIFYFVTYPIYYLKDDSKSNIKERIILSGITNKLYYIASFIGYSLFAFIVSMLSYIIDLVVLRVNYGENLLVLPIAIIPFIIIVVGIGTIVSILFKETES